MLVDIWMKVLDDEMRRLSFEYDCPLDVNVGDELEYVTYSGEQATGFVLKIDESSKSVWLSSGWTLVAGLQRWRRIGVAESYGVWCERCREYFPDAVVVKGFKCWACRR